MRKPQAQQLAAWIFGSASFLFLIWVFIFGPKELPPHKHQLLGLFFAPGGWFPWLFHLRSCRRQRRNQTSGIRADQDQGGGGGAAPFMLVLLWWRSKLSPVKVQAIKAGIDDIKKLGTHHSASLASLDKGQALILAAIEDLKKKGVDSDQG